MSLWKKAKEAAQKAAEAAEKVKDKTVAVAKDQYYREDSAFNKAATAANTAKDKTLAAIDDIDGGRNRDIEDAKELQRQSRGDKDAPPPPLPEDGEWQPQTFAEAEPDPEPPQARFPNSEGWSDEDVFHKVVETMFPDFQGVQGEKRWAVCEIARYEKKIVNLNRSIGSAFIETRRQLAEQDPGYRTVLQAAGAWDDQEISRAFQYWQDDLYDDAFYADDDGGRSKGERLLGWLVLNRCGTALVSAFADSGLEDPFGLTRAIQEAQPLLEARAAVAMKHFRPRRSKFDTDFIVQRGLNAEFGFMWLEPDGDTPSDGESSLIGGAGLTEL